MQYGYARVSTADQCLQAQVDSLEAAGVDKVFTDHGVSGAKDERPALDQLRAALQPGDVVMVTKMDRLFRSLRGAVNQLEDWTEAGVGFACLDQPMMNTADDNPQAKLLRGMLSVFAEFERDMILARTAEGRARAQAAGVKFGRKPKLSADQLRHAAELVEGGQSVRQVAKLFNVDHAGLLRRLAKV